MTSEGASGAAATRDVGSGDAKRLIREGYDEMAGRFAEWQRGVVDSPRMRYLGLLLDAMPPRARILELGCGAAVGSTRTLAARGELTGVDISGEQLRRARERLPDATFIEADVTQVEFEPESFDAVAAFYVMNHVPSPELPMLLGSVARWLRPGGAFVANFAAGAGDAVDPDWLGVPMFFGGVGAERSLELIGRAGLRVVQHELVTQHEQGVGDVTFLWTLSAKPAEDGVG